MALTVQMLLERLRELAQQRRELQTSVAVLDDTLDAQQRVLLRVEGAIAVLKQILIAEDALPQEDRDGYL